MKTSKTAKVTTAALTLLATLRAGNAMFCRCVRCGLALEDAASRESGVGPICRKFANAVMAKTLKADCKATREALNELSPMLDDRASAVCEALVEELYTGEETGRTDYRTVATALLQLLSVIDSRVQQAKNRVCVALEALGYTALAGVVLRTASQSLATVTVEGDSIVVECKRNKAAITLFRAIAGRRYLGATSARKAWSFPLGQASTVLAAVRACYPLSTFVEAEIMTMVDAIFIAKRPARSAVAAPSAAVFTEPAPVASATVLTDRDYSHVSDAGVTGMTVELCRTTYRRVRAIMVAEGCTDFETLARAKAVALTPEGPTAWDFVRTALIVTTPCKACSGSGRYSNRSFSGQCFRCGGKGARNFADCVRNFWYDRKGARSVATI